MFNFEASHNLQALSQRSLFVLLIEKEKIF